MADAADEMNHQDVWDDSALVQSWNEALAEYKKYHSIHATGGSLDDLLPENGQHAKPETHLYQHGQPAPGPIAGEASESVVDGQGTNADTATEGAATTQQDRVNSSGNDDLVLNDTTRGAFGQSQGMEHASANIMPPPQALLGSVQDENLKRLLMSWYYAGFYTGLYEGQQKHRN